MDDREYGGESTYEAPEVEDAGSEDAPAVTAAGGTTTITTTVRD